MCNKKNSKYMILVPFFCFANIKVKNVVDVDSPSQQRRVSSG